LNDNTDLLNHKIDLIRDRILLTLEITPKKDNEIIDEHKFNQLIEVIYRFNLSFETRINFILKVDNEYLLTSIFIDIDSISDSMILK